MYYDLDVKSESEIDYGLNGACSRCVTFEHTWRQQNFNTS